jgi:hypothetical protein
MAESFFPTWLEGKHNQAYRAMTNSKAERIIQTLQAECGNAMSHTSSDERQHWLPRDRAIEDNRQVPNFHHQPHCFSAVQQPTDH